MALLHLSRLSPKPYLTAGEGLLFRKLLADGTYSRFRCRPCKHSKCDRSVPQGKDYCSEACYRAIKGGIIRESPDPEGK